MEQWFIKRRKDKVLEIAYRQMTVALDTVNDLNSALQSVSVGDKDKTTKIIERLFGIEEEIDDLRRTVFEELAKGNLPPRDREDIMHLVKRLDMMADHIKDAARNVLVLGDAEIPDEIWQAFIKMSSGLVATAAVLGESLKNLGEDPAESRVLSEKVEDEENRVDQAFVKIKLLLLKHDKKISPAVLLLLKDLLDSMEEAADSCADTGDYIRLLTVTYQ
jgi:predicted phosphate transport protein (TIGR00153 family)